jgi:uncharacterized protein YlxW (UPF0749 family)
MIRQKLLLPAIAAGFFVIVWGCSTATTNGDKSLEAKVAKMEKELKTLQDAQMQTAATLRLEQAKTAQLEKERDDLLAQVKTRTSERDVAFSQYEGFRKNLKELIGQADVAAAEMKHGEVATANAIPMPRRVDE